MGIFFVNSKTFMEEKFSYTAIETLKFEKYPLWPFHKILDCSQFLDTSSILSKSEHCCVSAEF